MNTHDRHAVSVREFAAAVGLGYSSAKQEVARERIRSFRVGRRRLIPFNAIQEWIDTNLAETQKNG